MAVKMLHPDINAAAEAVDERTYQTVWAPRGWKLMDEATEYANVHLGRFVRSTDDLTKDEMRALIPGRPNGIYPDEDATEDEVRTAYLDSFGEQRPEPVPSNESPTGVVVPQYDPGQYKVAEVLEHLETVDGPEQTRIMDAERTGQARVTILNWTPSADSDESADAEDEE